MNKPSQAETTQLHARLCSALADPSRIAMLYELAEGRRNVSDLVDSLGMPQSSVSRHLRVLRNHELVSSRREGKLVYYELADPRVITALDTLHAILIGQLQAHADLANRF